MKFQINEIDVDGIRTDTFRGDEYLVAPVTAMKAMNLDGGYVPEEHVRKSAPAWNGIPVTLYHPATAEGEPVSANSPDMAEKTWIGYFFNTEVEEDVLNGEVWLDIDHVNEMGGEAEEMLQNLQDGEPVSVSTSYFGDRLESGDYDGEFRENVVGNLKPDHLAMLPDKEGRCSQEDGCMAGEPAFNDELVFTNTSSADTDDPEEPGEDAEMTIGKKIATNIRKELNSWKFKDTNMTEREEMIEVLVNQHDFKEESLEGMGDACLEQTYNSFNSEEEEEEMSENEGLTAEDVQEIVDEASLDMSEIEETVKQQMNEVEQSNEQEELVETILDNSEEYDEEELSDTPTAILENIKDDVTTVESDVDYSGIRGANSGSVESEDFPDLSVPEADE